MTVGILAWGFVHRLAPGLVTLWSVRLYYYGLAYALGFAGVLCWFLRRRRALGWSARDVLDLAILFAAGVLLLGRAFEIVVYEWDYYTRHPEQLLDWWRGGMASHGVLLGAVVGVWAFCRWRRRPFLVVLEEVVVPAAFFLGLGRIGNFINGEIIGAVTHVPWGVRFPVAEGLRHPVTLYEAAKNFAIVPILLWVRRRSPPGRGRLLPHFVFWYGFLRIFTDLFREYGKESFGIGRGQYFNVLMAAAGVALYLWLPRHARRKRVLAEASTPLVERAGPGPKRRMSWEVWARSIVFAALLVLSLTIPCAWTKGSLHRSAPPAPRTRPHPASADSSRAAGAVSCLSPTERGAAYDLSPASWSASCSVARAVETSLVNLKILSSPVTMNTPHICVLTSQRISRR